MARKSKGRQKIPMVKIKRSSNLMVTYSKRRTGLFKKGCELATLCGAEVAIIVFSPGRKAYSFGHPSVDRVVDHYVTGLVPQPSTAVQLIDAHRDARTHDLNMHITQVLHDLEMERKHGEGLDRLRREIRSQSWWESPIDRMSMAQLERVNAAFQELRQYVANRAEQLSLMNAMQTQAQQNFAPNGYLVAPNAAPFAPAPAPYPYDQTNGYNFGYGNNGFF